MSQFSPIAGADLSGASYFAEINRCGKRGDLIKVIWHDGQGACLFSKRLERGRFIWPAAKDGRVTISPAQLGYMLEGIDWRFPQKTYRPEIAG